MITQAGSLNTTALNVPGLYVNIVPPAQLILNGVPSNVVGVVGTATWGPVGVPIVCSGQSDATPSFGPIQVRKYDLVTAIAVAAAQGANSFKAVRWTDGSDAAATGTITGGVQNAITFTARYTGTLGNSIIAALSVGSKGTGYWRLTIGIGNGLRTYPARPLEVFDNLGFGLTGNAVWQGLAAAVNTGISAQRGPSQLLIATAGSAIGMPNVGNVAMTGGTDGASTPSAVATNPALAFGVDVAPRTGMYALRSQGCSIGLVADMDTPAAWSTIDTFGASEGIYMQQSGPSGDSQTNAVTTWQGVSVDSYSTKMMFGDWVYWQDAVNGVLRLVSPASVAAGRLANLAPNQSSLNKPLGSIVGTQKSGAPGTGQTSTYAPADLQALFAAGLDVIASPSPGGGYFSVQDGHNTSSNAGTNGDNYTRMVNYMASTLNGGMGKYVGAVITSDLFANITGTLNQFMQNMLTQGMLTPNADGSLPYIVVCNASNNPQSRTSLGYVQADVQVTLEGINEKFIVNLQAGVGVQTQRVPGQGS